MTLRLFALLALATLGAEARAVEPWLELGPMIGHVGPNEARVWCKASRPTRPWVWVSRWPDLTEAQIAGGPQLTEAAGRMGHVRVTELEPDTTYYYAMRLDDTPVMARPYPSFRTPPAPGTAGRLRLAFTSCLGVEGAESAVGWAELDAKARADVILLLGDNHYADTTDVEKQRAAYFSHRDVASFRAATARTPTYAIWDDHDYGPNDSDRTAAGKEESLETFKQHWANPSYGLPDQPGIYSTFVRGDVQFFLLDDRFHRDPNRDPDSPDKTMLGAAQKAWLKQELKKSRAKLKLVACGSEFQLNGHNDSWSSFSFERSELFDFIEQNKIEGVIFLTGDRHFSGGYQIAGKLIEITAGPMGAKNYPTKNLPEMFLNHGEGKMFCVLDVDTTVDPPAVAVEVHRAGVGLLKRRPLSWDEICGRAWIETLNRPKPPEKEGVPKPELPQSEKAPATGTKQ